MKNQALIHDTAFAVACAIRKRIIADGELDEENRQIIAWAELYEIVRAGLEIYEIKAERRLSRLEPGRN